MAKIDLILKDIKDGKGLKPLPPQEETETSQSTGNVSADFGTIMALWRQMCDSMDKAYGMESCDNCPIYEITDKNCGGIWEIPTETDWSAFVNAVNEWATTQTPKYPTWFEWLTGIDLRKILPQASAVLPDTELLQPIPTETAVKLGIDPVG